MVLGAFVVFVVGLLIVNYFKDKKSQTLPALSTETSVNKEHVVVKGETLWSIAEDSFGSGYNWIDLKKANNLKTDRIEIGQKLTIPEVSVKKPTSTKPIATTSYVVVKGDSLWNVAVRAYGDGYKWIKIAKANNLTNPNIIHPGNILTLPR